MLLKKTTILKFKSSKHDTSILADSAVLSVAFVWGASYPVAKGALIFAPVLTLILLRFLITAIIMTWIAKRDIAVMKKRNMAFSILSGSILFLIFIAETYGVLLTSATNTALIISLCVIFTPLLDYGLRKTLPPFTLLACIIVSFAGIAILTGGMSSLNIGDFLVLCAAMLRAIMVVSSKRLMMSDKVSPKALTAIQAATVTGLTLALILTTWDEKNLIVPVEFNFWAAIIFLSIFCTVAAFYIQNAAVKHTSPTRVSLLMSTEPLFGFGLAYLLLHEPITLDSALGASLIVIGTFAAIMCEKRLEVSKLNSKN